MTLTFDEVVSLFDEVVSWLKDHATMAPPLKETRVMSEASFILPNLFIGSIEDRQDTATLRRMAIRLIVCCCHSGRASLFSFVPTGGNTKEVFTTHTEFEDAMRRSDGGGTFLLELPMDDTTTFDIFSFFPMTSSVIRTAREDKQWAVFVHCIAGVSRSASVVAAYLLQTPTNTGTHMDCISFLKSKRPCVNPISPSCLSGRWCVTNLC